jgi:hypothetical protein
MKAFIFSIQPNPIAVHSGDTQNLKVSVLSTEPILGSHLVITNKCPQAAQLFDSDESADTVHSDPNDLSIGINKLTHQVGFMLEQTASISGAIIGIEIFVEDSNGNQISSEEKLLATIGARS